MKIRTHLAYQNAPAFTLVELLLVLVILGILAAIVVPKFAGRTEQAKQRATETQISAFSTALGIFETDNGYYPKGKDGLQDLRAQPRDAQNWHGPYMEKDIPLDPWNHPYIYVCPGKHRCRDGSMGPRGCPFPYMGRASSARHEVAPGDPEAHLCPWGNTRCPSRRCPARC